MQIAPLPRTICQVPLDSSFFMGSLDTIQEIFASPELDTSNPDKLAEILMQVCEHHGSIASYLFSCLTFNSLSLRSQLAILSHPKIDKVSAFADIYFQLADLLAKTAKSENLPNRPMKTIEDVSDPFNGIFAYLNRSMHGNCMQQSQIAVMASTTTNYLLYPNPEDPDFEIITRDKKNSWITFDFGEGHNPLLTDYTLYSYNGPTMHMKHWDIYGSDDYCSWTRLQSVRDHRKLNALSPTTFAISMTKTYRYIQIRQVGKNQGGSYEIALRRVEFFGTVPGTNIKAEVKSAGDLDGLVRQMESRGIMISCFSSSDGLESIFDNTSTDVWESAEIDEPSITIDFDRKRVVVNKYSIKQEQVNAGFVKEWSLQGSLNGIEWTTLSRQTRKTFPSLKQRWETFNCTNAVDTPFKLIKFVHHGPSISGDRILRLTNLELFGQLIFE